MQFLRWISILVLVFSLALQSQTPISYHGVVEGYLIYPDGKPAPGFMVSIIPTSPTSRPHSDVRTDSAGHFRFENLSFGSYALTSYLNSETSRYPAGTGDFFDKRLLRLLLSQQSRSVTVVLQLDRPLLILSGTVKDAVTSRPVIATINMWQTVDPENKWVRFGSAYTGAYTCLLPPGKTILLRATAPGYRDYETTIPAITDGVDPVVNIAMQPLPAPAQPPNPQPH